MTRKPDRLSRVLVLVLVVVNLGVWAADRSTNVPDVAAVIPFVSAIVLVALGPLERWRWPATSLAVIAIALVAVDLLDRGWLPRLRL